MDKKTATRPFLSQDQSEKWRSRNASTTRNNTAEAQAVTDNLVQPLDYLVEGEKTMSRHPEDLQKALDSLPDSRPDTPSSSATSYLSRSDTISSSTSIETQGSSITGYSQANLSSYDTLRVLRSLTLPTAMGANAADVKPFLKRSTFPVLEVPRSLLDRDPTLLYQSGSIAPMDQHGHDHINRHATWPEILHHPSQSPPAQTHSSTVERSRNPVRPEDTRSFIFEETMGSPVLTPSDSDSNVDSLQHQARDSGIDISYSWTSQDTSSSEAVNPNLQHAMINSFHCEPHGFQPPFSSISFSKLLLQRPKKTPRNRSRSKFRKGLERVVDLAPQHTHAERERQHSPDSAISSTCSTIVDSEATVEPEDRSMNDGLPQEDDNQKSRSPTPSPPTNLVGNRKRESSRSDSDDSASFLHEKTMSIEENDELAYDKLVESIHNLILKSSCYPQDRDVPVERYVHNLLEKVLNHQKPVPASQRLCLQLPIRTLPAQSSEAHCDAGESDTGARDQRKSNGRKKRKSNEPPVNTRNRSDQDEDDSCDSQEEEYSNDHQKGKKPKLEKNDENLSCPFRKRNPTRFNVRDHGNCALNPFSTLPLLKRHIKLFHLKKNSVSSCIRCKEQFLTPEALTDHVRQPVACLVRDSDELEDPENGITKDVLRALTARTNGDKINSWESVYTRLFPDDSVPKSNHEPPVELDEAEEHCFDKEALHDFVQKKIENGQSASSEEFFIERLKHSRSIQCHHPSKERDRRDLDFLEIIRNKLSASQDRPQQQPHHQRQHQPQRQPQHQSQHQYYYAQQMPSVVLYNQPQEAFPNEWACNQEDPLAFENLLDPFNSNSEFDPHPPFSVNSVLVENHGLQIPTQDALTSSDLALPQARPQHPSTNYSYTTIGSQNAANPCPPARSGHPSSGRSSQTHDSGYQTQEPDAAHLLSDGRTRSSSGGGGGGDSNCSTSPGGIPGRQPPPKQSSELWGVGAGPSMGPGMPGTL